MYKFRIYPSRRQQARLFVQFDICCRLYNILLEQARTDYKVTGEADVRKFTLNNRIKAIKDSNPELNQVFSQALQNIADRLAKAYANFFRRLKEKKAGRKIKVGFPRFKKRFESITYPQFGFKFKSPNRLYCSRIGSIPIVTHRGLRGKIKTLTIKCNQAGQWFVVFACEVGVKAKTNHGEPVGIDVGLENFATLSNGIVIENPEYFRRSEVKVKRLQRQVSKKAKDSRNRRKAIHRLAKAHLKVANQRGDFLHKLSRGLVDAYGKIAVEKLNVNGMLKNHHLAKSIADASWFDFIRKLQYKAESAGCEVIEVEPKGTSQRCSNCGELVKKSLGIRNHKCPHCGFSIHRDLNASINILRTAGIAGT